MATYEAIYDYLGMTIDWSNNGDIRFTMCNFLENILEETSYKFNKEDTTPATKFLFQVKDLPLLNEKLADQLHRTVVRFLYTAKRARPDIQVAVALLCKHVKSPNTGK